MLEKLFQLSTNKYRRGFTLNHDNLMIATPEERQTLIFYFIASQVPEKLDPEDRESFAQEQYSGVEQRASFVGLFFATTWLVRFPYIGSKLNRRWGINAAIAALGGSFMYCFGDQLMYTLWEPKFVATNDLVQKLAQKYSFSVFDFAQAKKEAHLKTLREDLVATSPVTGY